MFFYYHIFLNARILMLSSQSGTKWLRYSARGSNPRVTWLPPGNSVGVCLIPTQTFFAQPSIFSLDKILSVSSLRSTHKPRLLAIANCQFSMTYSLQASTSNLTILTKTTMVITIFLFSELNWLTFILI